MMRLLLFALMIAVLPLRGWMGDAMATEMALAQFQPAQSATKIIAAGAHEMGNGAHFYHEAGTPEAVHDCGEPASDDALHAENAYCESCAACQVCQTLALAPVATDLNAPFSARTLTHAASTRFASAEAVFGQKPPIS